jgi:hypothetical protein
LRPLGRGAAAAVTAAGAHTGANADEDARSDECSYQLADPVADAGTHNAVPDATHSAAHFLAD